MPVPSDLFTSKVDTLPKLSMTLIEIVLRGDKRVYGEGEKNSASHSPPSPPTQSFNEIRDNQDAQSYAMRGVCLTSSIWQVYMGYT